MHAILLEEPAFNFDCPFVPSWVYAIDGFTCDKIRTACWKHLSLTTDMLYFR